MKLCLAILASVAALAAALGGFHIGRAAVMSGAPMQAGLGWIAAGLFIACGFAALAAGLVETKPARRGARRNRRI